MEGVRKRSIPMLASAAAHLALLAAAWLCPASRPELPPVPPPFVRVALTPPPRPASALQSHRTRRIARLEAPAPVRERPAAPLAPLPEAPRLDAETSRAPVLPTERFDVQASPPAVETVVRTAGFEGVALQAQAPAREARLQAGVFHGASGAPGGAPRAQVRQGGFAASQTSASAGRPASAPSSGGFGDAAARVERSPAPAVSAAGFGAVRGEKAEARAAPGTGNPDAEPVEILSKPRPVYTPQAREARIEGDVVLEVRFGSSGAVEVLRMVRGLGFGLDEAAAEAVRAMRFKPAAHDGVPVDSTLSVSVTFRLAY